MLLAVNIGNTTLTCGLFVNDTLTTSWKLPTHSDEPLFANQTISPEKIEAVVLGSVVPEKTPTIVHALKENHLPHPLIVTGDIPLPIHLAIDNPKEVGADIIADLAGAKKMNKTGVIIVDSGTATTFNVLSNDNAFLGTVIAPGMESMAKSLTDHTALLPDIAFDKPKHILGTNTIECMQSGIYFGYVGLINEILERLKKEFPDATVIGTGGNIQNIMDDVRGIDSIHEHLTLEGLYTIYITQASLG